jgi:hypothetical protein
MQQPRAASTMNGSAIVTRFHSSPPFLAWSAVNGQEGVDPSATRSGHGCRGFDSRATGPANVLAVRS